MRYSRQRLAFRTGCLSFGGCFELDEHSSALAGRSSAPNERSSEADGCSSVTDECSSTPLGCSSAADERSCGLVGCSSGVDERSFPADGGSFCPPERPKTLHLRAFISHNRLMPSRTSYMPITTQGIGTMLTAFASNIPGALATKYGVTAAEIQSVTQAQYGVSSCNTSTRTRPTAR